MTHDELLTRGVAKVIPELLAKEGLKSGNKLRIYFGIDPTGPKLHLGHSIPLRKLQAFADAGHHAIFLIGSYTAMIGDPTGKDTMREILTKEQVQRNFQDYRAQAEKILDFSKVEIRYNDEWLSKLSFDQILKISGQYSVQQMQEREMYKKQAVFIKCRNCAHVFKSPIQFPPNTNFELKGNKTNCPNCHQMTLLENQDIIFAFESPREINLTEFIYPLMQGYDSVALDVDCEIGGDDQLFNMLVGRKLQSAINGKQKFVLTTKLIEGTDGRKMSKTYDNCIYLTDDAKDMYGKVMSIKDDLMEMYFECCTDVPMDEVKKILKGSPRDAKARLALEITTLYHGAEAAKNAEAEFSNVFSKGQVPDDMPEVKVKKGELLIDILARENIVSSKSEARRLIEQKAVSVDGELVTGFDAVAKKGIVKVGKRKFVRVI